MLRNVDNKVYGRFKIEGYRIKKFKLDAVVSLEDVVRLAYLDVNRTITGVSEEQSRSLRQTVIVAIRNILHTISACDFDRSHDECCQECISCSTASAPIHYGQAQKILNMSLKYLYNEYASYRDSTNSFGFPENNVERLFHLPIDNQILDCLIGSHCRFIRPTNKPWSQWEHSHYLSLQTQLRERMEEQYCALEIDYMIWNTERPSLTHAIRGCSGPR